MLDLFINVASIDTAGAAAATERGAHNTVLLRTSWAYLGGLSSLLTILAATAWCTRIPVAWRHIVAENIALIVLLGCYEAMFFRTIAFQYDAVSMAELDRLVVDQIQAQC